MSEHDQPFYVSQNSGFGSIEHRDELLHPDAGAGIADVSLTETQYLGFSIPEERIHALGYLWHHPNLRVVSGGIYVWRGFKTFMPQAELCDMRAFMSDALLSGDLHEYRLDNGYGVRIVEPLKRLQMSYADTARQNRIALEYEALAPPIMFGDGRHFEQSMRVRGEIVLRGRRYEVNCYNVRDRSWGKPRPETIMPLPPVSWMTGVFGPDFSFNCNVLDQADQNPELRGRFELPAERTLNGGWLLREGRLGRIVSASKRVERDPLTRCARHIDLSFTDDLDRSLSLQGEITAACPWQVWPNLIFMVCQVRWRCDGRETHGDCQEAYWNDYLCQFDAASAAGAMA